MNIFTDNRGIALIIVLVVLGAVVAIGLGIATIVVRELRVSSLLDNSVSAIMAADAGIEQALWEVRKNGVNPTSSYSGTLSNGATYEVCPSSGPGGSDCSQKNPVRIISEGTFEGTTRSLQVEF